MSYLLAVIALVLAWAAAGVAGAWVLGRITKLGFDRADFWFGVITGPFLLLPVGQEWLRERNRIRRKTP